MVPTMPQKPLGIVRRSGKEIIYMIPTRKLSSKVAKLEPGGKMPQFIPYFQNKGRHNKQKVTTTGIFATCQRNREFHYQLDMAAKIRTTNDCFPARVQFLARRKAHQQSTTTRTLAKGNARTV